MDALLSVTLEAHLPERNLHRFYEIRIGRDLFGVWILTVRFGRVGHWGRTATFSSPDRTHLYAELRPLLLRRLSAPQRIGCKYFFQNGFCSAESLWEEFLPDEEICQALTIPELLAG